jgi:hypothetical protein
MTSGGIVALSICSMVTSPRSEGQFSSQRPPCDRDGEDRGRRPVECYGTAHSRHSSTHLYEVFPLKTDQRHAPRRALHRLPDFRYSGAPSAPSPPARAPPTWCAKKSPVILTSAIAALRAHCDLDELPPLTFLETDLSAISITFLKSTLHQIESTLPQATGALQSSPSVGRPPRRELAPEQLLELPPHNLESLAVAHTPPSSSFLSVDGSSPAGACPVYASHPQSSPLSP